MRRGRRGGLGRQRREPALLIRRAPDVVDEDLLERRLGDLEVADPRAGLDRGGEEDVRLDALVELDLGPVDPRPDDPGARHRRQPGEAVVALDRQLDHPPAGRPLDLAERPTDDHPAAIDDRDRLAHGLDRLHLVGREDERPTFVAELEERLAEEGDVDGIETGERLVHEQDRRVVEDRRDQLDLLLVALAELFGLALGQVGHAQAMEPGEGVAPGDVARHAVERGEEHQLIEDDHPRIQPALLGQVAPRRPWQLARVGAVPQDPAAVRGQDADRDSHRRRLAGPVRAEEAEDLAGRHLERQPVEGHDGPEGLVEVVDLETHRPRIARLGPGRARTMVPGGAMMTR